MEYKTALTIFQLLLCILPILTVGASALIVIIDGHATVKFSSHEYYKHEGKRLFTLCILPIMYVAWFWFQYSDLIQGAALVFMVYVCCLHLCLFFYGIRSIRIVRNTKRELRVPSKDEHGSCIM